jgi:tripartite-type tricarboxylate transporter receptor subunit TctC
MIAKKIMLGCLLGLTVMSAIGQTIGNYPNKPIKIVVPFPPGGTSDVLARLVGQKLSDSMGQQVIVDNKPGSSGNIGADMVAKSAPDGYTLVLMDVGNLAISPSLYKLPFNVSTDFTPVSMVAYSPHLLVVSNQVPAKTTKELIEWVKSKNGKVNYAAAAGMGSATHLAGVMFAQKTGLNWGYIPYKGGSQAMTDLIGGQVDITFNGMVATYPHVKSGNIKLIAVSSAKRQAVLGSTPTVNETVPGFLTGSWQGILAPANTPKPIVEKLQSEIARVMSLPDVKERLIALGAEPHTMTSVQFSTWLNNEMKVMAKVVKDGNVTID